MGLFGGNRSLTAAQQVARGGDGMDPSTVGQNRVFGDGSVGGIIGGLAKLLAYGPFTGVVQQNMNHNREDRESDIAYRRAQIDKMDRPQPINLGDGGVALFDPNTSGLNVIRQPTAPDHSSETERLLEQWKNTPPGPQRDLIERVLKGYQYTAPVMQAQQANRIALRQVPTYSNLHPRARASAAPKPPAGFILD